MRLSSFLFCLWTILPLLPAVASAQSPNGAVPAAPTDFDPSAKTPPDLPAKINIPTHSRIEIKGWRKKPLPPPLVPITMDNPRFLCAPDLDSAVIERGEGDIHAVFHWQGGRSNDAFVIRGLCFAIHNFVYPNYVTTTGDYLNLWLNGEHPNAGACGDFPGIYWYTPSTFAGTASLNGSKVLVFTPGGKKGGVKTYPEGETLCLDPKTLTPVWLDNGMFVYTFSTSPATNVQINPQGPYLEAIQKQFGHYP